MKEKILPIFLIILLLFANYSIAVEYTRTGGANVNSIATVIDDDTYIDAKYNAKSFDISSDIKIYEFNSNVEQVYKGYVESWTTSIPCDKNEYYISFIDYSDTNHTAYYSIRSRIW